MSLLYCHVQIPGLQVALNSVCPYSLTNDVVPGPSQLPEQFFDFPTMVLSDFFLAGNTSNDLTAVTAGSTPTNPIGLNDVNIVATLGQVQCGRNSRKPCTDYTDISRFFTQQWSEICYVVDGGGVVRACMRFGANTRHPVGSARESLRGLQHIFPAKLGGRHANVFLECRVERRIGIKADRKCDVQNRVAFAVGSA